MAGLNRANAQPSRPPGIGAKQLRSRSLLRRPVSRIRDRVRRLAHRVEIRRQQGSAPDPVNFPASEFSQKGRVDELKGIVAESAERLEPLSASSARHPRRPQRRGATQPPPRTALCKRHRAAKDEPRQGGWRAAWASAAWSWVGINQLPQPRDSTASGSSAQPSPLAPDLAARLQIAALISERDKLRASDVALQRNFDAATAAAADAQAN